MLLEPSLPLGGKHIVWTGPVQTRSFDDPLQKAGAVVHHIPLIQFEAVAFSLPSRKPNWLFFTSQTAVHYFFSQVDPASITCPVGVVGRKTQEALQTYHLEAAFVPDDFTAENAARQWCQSNSQALAGSELHVLWPCGNLANPAFKKILEQNQVAVRPLCVYKTLPVSKLPPNAIELFQKEIHYLVFTSPSAIEVCKQAIEAGKKGSPQNSFTLPESLQSFPVACIGPTTAEAARQYFTRVNIVPQVHTAEELATAILKES
ncbi:MAG: uroporphyrinogen-III synthase [Vampirovibrio sp.]|nr:uroporphyrinogen-III synthase [Vampirovibrio sp.]